MPPQRSKLRRTATLTGSFYDKSGSIGDPTAAADRDYRDADMGRAASSKRGDDSDDEHCLTGYGKLASETQLMFKPPSPTQTQKYRFRDYKPRKVGKKHRAAANEGTGKTKSSPYHKADYSSLDPYLQGLGSSPKRDFQALLHKYRQSADGWRDDSSSSPRKTYSDQAWSPAGTPSATPVGTPLRREGSRIGRSAF